MQNTIKELYLLQKNNFQSGKTQELAFKKQALKTLKSVIKKYENMNFSEFLDYIELAKKYAQIAKI